MKWFTVLTEQLPELFSLRVVFIFLTFYFLSGMDLIEYAFFSLNEIIYMKVLCKTSSTMEMEDGMIITSRGLQGHKLQKASSTWRLLFFLLQLRVSHDY